MILNYLFISTISSNYENIKNDEQFIETLALAGLMTACNHNDVVNPTGTTGVTNSDQNAKISPLIKLVKHENNTIQYVKSGRFFGKISQVNKYPSDDYYTTYSYNDSNPSGELWISKKRYKSSNNLLVSEEKFKVVNGLCIYSETGLGSTFEYKYNPQGYLDEIKLYNNQAQSISSWTYKYDFTSRLTSIDYGKPSHNYELKYGPSQDKYHLNNEYGIPDKYLQIFGQHSNPLIHIIVDQNLQTNTTVETYYNGYQMNNDGLVDSRNVTKNGAVHVETFNYSDNWQGIP